MKTFLRFALLALLSASTALGATVPERVAFTGYLKDTINGLVSGNKDLKFGLYVNGTRVWYARYATTAVANAYFNVNLGVNEQGAQALDPGTGAPGGSLPITSTLLSGVTGSSSVEIEVELLNLAGTAYDLFPQRFPISSALFALQADRVGGYNAAQLAKQDGTGRITASGGTPVIDAAGNWIGSPTGLVGPQGPAGPQGAMGAQGDPGPMGLPGAQGLTGVMGVAGPQGAQGLPGAQGAMGLPGATGAQGTMGPQGLTGAAGAAGAQGAMGVQGLPGATGAAGAPGAQGIPGTPGAMGSQGPQGVKGDTGDAGAAGAAGVAGPAGPKGDAGEAGAPGPAGAPGMNGGGVLYRPFGLTGTKLYSYSGPRLSAKGKASADIEAESYYVKNASTASLGATAGIIGPFIQTQARHSPVMTLMIRTDAALANSRLWLALTSADLAQTDAIGALATRFYGLRCSSSAGDATWQIVTGNGTTTSAQDTGVPVTPGTAYLVTLDVSVAGEFTVTINGTAVTKTTNLDPVGATNLGVQASVTALDAAIHYSRIAQIRLQFIGAHF